MVTPEFDERFSVRCTSHFKMQIEKIAQEKGMTLSEYVRTTLSDASYEEAVISKNKRKMSS